MKHLHFTQSLEPLQGGGLGVSTIALHRQFLARGVESTVCSTYGESPQKLADRTHEFRRSRPGFLYYAPGLRNRAKEFITSADVIHGHGLYVGTNCVLGTEARRQGKALVYHSHGFFDPWILSRSRWKKRLVHWLFEDANFQHVKLWRALTVTEADQIRAQGVKAPIVVVPIGIDLKPFETPFQSGDAISTPLSPQLVKTRYRAVFVSRLHPKKGLDLLLAAWTALAEFRRDWELIIAGPDEGGYAADVDAWIQKLGVANSVQRVGKVSSAAKIKLLKSADVFVLPSYSEGFTSVILEAMAASTPVIATRACNFPELFQNGGGWECEPTADSLGKALMMALRASESERRDRGQNGRRLVETGYGWPFVVDRLLQACAVHC